MMPSAVSHEMNGSFDVVGPDYGVAVVVWSSALVMSSAPNGVLTFHAVRAGGQGLGVERVGC